MKPIRFHLHILNRPRSLIAILVGVAVWLGSGSFLAPSTRFVVAVDAGGLLFLILTATMVMRATLETIRHRARKLDEGEIGMVVVTVGAAALSLAAIFVESRGAKEMPPAVLHLHLALAAGSIVLAWLVTHTLFALHYAHLFYGDEADAKGARGGLAFPGEKHPDYWDFLYFAFVVGMTCQTSDVGVTGRVLRRLTLLHGVLSFFFNTVVLAMAINIAASLL